MFLSHEELISQLCQHILFLQTTAWEIMFKILFQLGPQLGQMGQETKGWYSRRPAALHLSMRAHNWSVFRSACGVQHTAPQQTTCIRDVLKGSESRTALSDPESSRLRRQTQPRVCLQMERLPPAPCSKRRVPAIGLRLLAEVLPHKHDMQDFWADTH